MNQVRTQDFMGPTENDSKFDQIQLISRFADSRIPAQRPGVVKSG